MALKALLFVLAFASVIALPSKVVLDTDIGSDFDDTWALIYILSRPDLFDLQLVQVSTFDTNGRAQITAKILDLLHRTHIPIGIGYPKGDQGMPMYPWAKNYSLNTFKEHGGVIYEGTSAFAKILEQSTPTDPVYIVEIAPVNSLGDILIRNPKLAANSICVAMSGSVYKGYLNSPSPSAEYNVVTNITSSQAMYNAVWHTPLYTAPLDTCNFDQWNGDVYKELLAANNSAHPYVQILLETYQVWYDNGGRNSGAMLPFSPTTGTDVLYDAQAAWMTGQLIANATEEPLVLKGLPLVVNSSGFTVVTTDIHDEVNVAIGFTRHPMNMKVQCRLVPRLFDLLLMPQNHK